ncbi:hypothetical protein [Rhodopila sp.]|uniref:hypothetical protein n=1 Tax=Rhodopila sp. TaxID=2480087 RepID=UPI003D0DFC20
MNRIKATNSVAFSSRDIAPITGTPQYATDGNPATGIPGTIWPAYAFNMIQDEIVNAILAAGVTPDDTNWAQLAQAIQTLGGSVVGSIRNGLMWVTAPSISATFSADEVVVETALAGSAFRLGNFSHSINLTVTGVNGMDTGSAPTSGFVGIYAIYNPTSGASALLATNATTAAVPNVYAGGHMPAGYTFSALVSVWPTDSSGRFIVGYQRDRSVDFFNVLVATITSVASLTALSVASVIPKNAVEARGVTSALSSAAGSLLFDIFSSAQSTGCQINASAQAPGEGIWNSFSTLLSVAQTLYYTITNVSGTVICTIYMNGYKF